MNAMTPEQREQFYDSEIAPALLELAGKCERNGLSLIAMAEWEPGETGTTATLTKESGFGIRMAETAMRSQGNADAFIFALIKDAKEHGHNSVCLHLLERQS